jgi:hypothetical protein
VVGRKGKITNRDGKQLARVKEEEGDVGVRIQRPSKNRSHKSKKVKDR